MVSLTSKYSAPSSAGSSKGNENNSIGQNYSTRLEFNYSSGNLLPRMPVENNYSSSRDRNYSSQRDYDTLQAYLDSRSDKSYNTGLFPNQENGDDGLSKKLKKENPLMDVIICPHCGKIRRRKEICENCRRP